MNSLSVPLVLLLALIWIFLLPCESSNNVIEETCKKTKNYSLCVSTLESDPRSAASDPLGLAKITVDILSLKANATLRKSIWLYTGNGSDPILYKFYGTCIDVYITSTIRLIPGAVRELGSRKFPEARADATKVANNAETCGKQFAGRSDPLIGPNDEVHDVSIVAADIIGSLASVDRVIT